MATIIDLRGKTMDGGDRRAVSRIRNIAVHYSATTEGDVFAFERHWKGARGWKHGGYHEIVLTNGNVQLCYNPDVISNGVKGHNSVTYNICYVGTGKPNAKQLQALIERVNYNRKRFGVAVSNVKGHREFSGQSTSCPALDMNEFRAALENGKAYEPAPVKTKPTDVKSKSNAKLTIDGKWGPATTRALQRTLGTPIDGVISRQLQNDVTKALYGGIEFGKGGSPMVRALQRKVGARVDGYLGPETVRRLQRYLGTPVDGKISRPNSKMVFELQKRLNKGTF